MGLGIVVGVAPDIGVGEVLGSSVLLLEMQVQGLALPVLPMLSHCVALEGPEEWGRCYSASECWLQ